MNSTPTPSSLDEYPGYLSVAQVVKLLNITARAIQHYETIKLIKSKRVGKNNLRLLDEHNMDRLRAILEAKDLGFPLNEIAIMLEEMGDKRQKQILHIEEDAIEQQLAVLREEAERIQIAIRKLKELKRMSRTKT